MLKSNKESSSKYLSFGNSIHTTLAQFNHITTQEYRTLESLHKLLRKNWIRDGYESREEEREYGLKALEMLENYFNEPRDQGKKNMLIEEMIRMDMGGKYILTGKLDKVYLREDEKIETTDYKTGNTIEVFNKLQLPIYILLTKEKTGHYPDIISYYYLVHNKKIEMEVTKELIDEVVHMLGNIYEQMSAEKEYSCSPSEYCENTCEYFENCNEAKDTDAIMISLLRELDHEVAINTIF